MQIGILIILTALSFSLHGMNMNGPFNLFGTDGIRSEVFKFPLSPHHLIKISQAFGYLIRQKYESKPKIILGKDTRASGYMIECALTSGLCSSGCDVFFLGPIPTAGVSYLVKGLRAQGGIMISASHNLWADNGLKFFDSSGRKLDQEDVFLINEFFQKSEEELLTETKSLGKAKRIDDALGQYSVFLKEKFPKNLNLEKLRIVLDCAHGAAYRIAPKFLRELGAEVIVIHDEPNGYNINCDSGSENPAYLKDVVRSEKADVGFALDGDSDRLVVVNREGEILSGEHLIALCSLFLKADNPSVVISNICNSYLKQFLRMRGCEVFECDVGDQNVLGLMKQRNSLMGGEPSGHIIFSQESHCSDALITILKVLQALLKDPDCLQGILNEFKLLPSFNQNIPIGFKPTLNTLPRFEKLLRLTQNDLADEGKVIFRYSGTEPKARLLIESPSDDFNREKALELSKVFLSDLEAIQESKRNESH